MASEAPDAAALQVVPPSVDSRDSKPLTPDPPVSVPAAAEIDTEATFCHDSEPPDTVGVPGAVRSIRATPCTHADVLPAPSTARNSTSVSPSAVTESDPPAAAADHVTPASVEVRDWYPLRAEPPESVDPPALSGSEATLC